MDHSQSIESSNDCTVHQECSESQIHDHTNEIPISVTETPIVIQSPDNSLLADRTPEFAGASVIPFQNHDIQQSVSLVEETFQQVTTHVDQEDDTIGDINRSILIPVESTKPKDSYSKNKTSKRKQGKLDLSQYCTNLGNKSEMSSQNEWDIPKGSAHFPYPGEDNGISIDVKQLCNIQRIGHGGFGKVYSVVIKASSDIPMAVKLVPRDKATVTEVTIMKEIATGSCQYIIDYYCALLNPVNHSLYICMEFMDASIDAFYKIMHQEEKLEKDQLEPLMRRIVHDVVSGLHYMMNKDIIHRDIKPENILINKNAAVKLCDFGISRTIARLSSYFNDTNNSNNSYLSPLIHTENYMPPRIKGAIQDDMWSLGVSLLEVVSGKNPFAHWPSGGRSFTLLNWKPVIPEIISGDMQQLIRHLLANDADNRPLTYDNILNIPWIFDVSETPSSDEYKFVRYIIAKIPRTENPE